MLSASNLVATRVPVLGAFAGVLAALAGMVAAAQSLAAVIVAPEVRAVAPTETRQEYGPSASLLSPFTLNAPPAAETGPSIVYLGRRIDVVNDKSVAYLSVDGIERAVKVGDVIVEDFRLHSISADVVRLEGTRRSLNLVMHAPVSKPRTPPGRVDEPSPEMESLSDP